MSTIEKRIEMQILNMLKLCGIFCFKIDRQGTFDPVKKVFRSNSNPHKLKGVSDILGIIEGRFLAIEVKSPVGKLSQDQKVFIRRTLDEGGLAFVARSTEQVAEELLKHYPNLTKRRQFTKNYTPPN